LVGWGKVLSSNLLFFYVKSAEDVLMRTRGKLQNRRINWKMYWKRATVVVMESTLMVTLLNIALFPIDMFFSPINELLSPMTFASFLPFVLMVSYIPFVIYYTKTIKETVRYIFPLLGGILVFLPLSYWINYMYDGTMTTQEGVIVLSLITIPVGIITMWASLRLK
jgi:hypothetical protein